jgi:hypothetical protein
MSNLYLMVYGMPLALAVAVALVLGSLCWLLELFARRGVGVYLGYAATFVVTLCTARIIYGEVTECSGAFGRPVLFPQCEWSIVSRVLAVFLTVITTPLLVLSEIKLRRWSLNRAPLTN